MITVYPEPGMFPAIAKALLEVADHPGQVLSVSHPKAGFIVPQDVFERFEAQRNKDEASSSTPAPTEPVKRRPGRPRKNAEPVVSQDHAAEGSNA